MGTIIGFSFKNIGAESTSLRILVTKPYVLNSVKNTIVLLYFIGGSALYKKIVQ